MKRSWFGLALLAALLALSLWVQHYSKTLHEPIVEELRKAQAAAQSEDWVQTEKWTQQAQKRWRKNMDIRSAVCDHDYLEGRICRAEGLAGGQRPHRHRRALRGAGQQDRCPGRSSTTEPEKCALAKRSAGPLQHAIDAGAVIACCFRKKTSRLSPGRYAKQPTPLVCLCPYIIAWADEFCK